MILRETRSVRPLGVSRFNSIWSSLDLGNRKPAGVMPLSVAVPPFYLVRRTRTAAACPWGVTLMLRKLSPDGASVVRTTWTRHWGSGVS
jgi:hypothetical protein